MIKNSCFFNFKMLSLNFHILENETEFYSPVYSFFKIIYTKRIFEKFFGPPNLVKTPTLGI